MVSLSYHGVRKEFILLNVSWGFSNLLPLKHHKIDKTTHIIVETILLSYTVNPEDLGRRGGTFSFTLIGLDSEQMSISTISWSDTRTFTNHMSLSKSLSDEFASHESNVTFYHMSGFYFGIYSRCQCHVQSVILVSVKSLPHTGLTAAEPIQAAHWR